MLSCAVASLIHPMVFQAGADVAPPVGQSKPDALQRRNPSVEGRELIRDPQFRTGFVMLDPKPGKRVPYGRVLGRDARKTPSWDLAQWSSRYPLEPTSSLPATSGFLCLSNEAKAVFFAGRNSTSFDLSLAVNAGQEYGNRARHEGEPWVHLLVQQAFDAPPILGNIESAHLHIQARLASSRVVKTADYTPNLHAAQFQMFLTVQNRNRRSSGYGKYLWFGIPLYDDRVPFPKAHKSQDFGGTKMFIFTLGGEIYSSVSAHGGEWITVDKDLLPLMRDALETAWSRGFLQESKSMSDYAIGGMNLGWEVPGIFDVDMQVRNLSLKIIAR